MPVNGNKRASQLVMITPPEVALDDLFYLVDISAHESKKITASDLALYLNASGSLYAFHSIMSDTASFVLPGGIKFVVPSSSVAAFTQFAVSSSLASASISSSWSTTASFALNGEIGESQTASFLRLLPGASNGTASYSLLSAATRNAFSASYLIYTGMPNGTASYAITTQNVNHATNADTASFFDATIGTVANALHASEADHSIQSDTASFLQYNGVFNGTASFALNASSFTAGRFNDYGIFLATTQSTYLAQIDTLLVNPSSNAGAQTEIEAIGSATFFFTSSVLTNDSISLSLLDRFTGISQVIDSVPVFWNTTPIVDNWNTLLTGSMSIPFLLVSQVSNTGSFLVQVTSTPNVTINSNRTTRFSVASTSDGLSATSDAPIDFSYTPSSSIAIFFSGSSGPFTDALPGLQSTGSGVLTSINLSGSGVSSIRYTWKCVSLKTFNCSNNIFLNSLTYAFPNTLNTLICNRCNLGSLPNISNTSMSYFDCSQNSLNTVPDLPQTQNYTMSYFNCSSNGLTSLPLLAPSMSIVSCSINMLTSLPDPMPSGLKTIIADRNRFTIVSSTFPLTVATMSFASCSTLQSVISPFTGSLGYFVGDNSPIGLGGFPNPSVSMSFISLNNCRLPVFGPGSMDVVFSASLINAASHSLFSGSIDVRNNGTPDASTITKYITPLTSSTIMGGLYNWSILYDF